MNRRPLLQLLVALAACAAAGPLHAQQAEGKLYTPGAFDAVAISGSAEVKLVQGPRDEVFIEGDGDVQRQIDVRVRNGTLQVDSPGWKFWNSRRLQMTVTARDFSKVIISGSAQVTAPEPLKVERLTVHVSGAGMVQLRSLNADQFAFHATGSGDAEVAGRVQNLNVVISGRSEFRGQRLMSRSARVQISGLGDVKVWAVDDLMLQTSGVGEIEYWGTPNVLRRGGGMVNVTARGNLQAPPAPPAPAAAPAATARPAAPAAPVAPAWPRGPNPNPQPTPQPNPQPNSNASP